MRGSIVLVVWLVLVVPPAVAHAQDNEALRREVEQLRRQQEQYQKTIEALNERLKRLELQNAPAAAQPAPPATRPTAGTPVAPGAPAAAAPSAPPGATPVAQGPGGPSGSSPSALDLLSPRQPFSLYQQRGAGQLLFDMGVTGDFVGNLTQRNVQKAQDGTFSGRENRFFPREVELSLFGQIDPYARADVRIEAGEEAPGAETSVSLAEATITLLALPWGTQAKLGQMRNRYGWTNVVHEHDLPWVDRPDVYRIFFGEEGLVEKGGEATWVPDFLPFYLEVLGGVFNGDNETAFGYGRLTAPLVTGRIRAFFELTDSMALQVGTSVASGDTPDRLRSTLVGYDVKYKFRPEGWLHPLLTLASEGIYSIREVELAPDDKRTRDRFGVYGWGELQPWRRWAVGTRYDWTQYPSNPGHQWAVEPYLTFLPSEFLRFRLAYKHTERSNREGFDLNGGSGRIMDELFLQATFILGAHPAHPF
jgi:hypothetical protein